jgi:hypothetical protein
LLLGFSKRELRTKQVGIVRQNHEVAGGTAVVTETCEAYSILRRGGLLFLPLAWYAGVLLYASDGMDAACNRKARKEVNKRRRHFNMSKTGFVSQMGNAPAKTNPRDVLVDESKQADTENLGDCLRALGDGQSLGDFSLTIVLYGNSKPERDPFVGEFAGVFTNADSNLFVEMCNQLNAYFSTVPGNYALNLRKLYLLNTNCADLSFLFMNLPARGPMPILARSTWPCSRLTTVRPTSSACITARSRTRSSSG